MICQMFNVLPILPVVALSAVAFFGCLNADTELDHDDSCDMIAYEIGRILIEAVGHDCEIIDGIRRALFDLITPTQAPTPCHYEVLKAYRNLEPCGCF